MSQEVTSAPILQAINELTESVKELSQDLKRTEANHNAQIDKVEKNLNGKIDNVEKRLEEKITSNGEKTDKMDAKFSVMTDELLSTKEDVKMFKSVK